MRPDEVVQVYVSVMDISFPSLTVRAAIRREGQELAAVKERFLAHSTRLLQMHVSTTSHASTPGHAQNKTVSGSECFWFERS